ncbi:nucleoside deaminase [Fastidiosibacter lacustris]|uniref:nucleoside deaminase n=1 Tax=Fastidiosibacter lacustris TaxID=2056695 RepID=UPI000E34890A|nr:nucleoside deaminase [Fastidiosibacter lacustris]
MNNKKLIMNKLIAYTKLHSEQVPYGACIVDEDGEIIAYGLGQPKSSPTFHAEIMAINNCASQYPNIDWSKLTIYTTGEPCIMCSSAICWSGIREIVYGTPVSFMTKLWGIEASTTCPDIIKLVPNPPQLSEPICEDQCNEMFTEYDSKYRKVLDDRLKEGRGQSKIIREEERV